MTDSLQFSHLDENLFQAILVVSCNGDITSSEWMKRIIENSHDKCDLEFKPVLKNGVKMLRFDSLDPITKTIDPIKCHEALLDNKYYTTQIYLVELDEVKIFPDRFYEYVHGILILIDNNDQLCLTKLQKWTDYIEQMDNCSIKIVCCENVSEQSVIGKIDVQNYCIEKGFEMVELSLEHINQSEPNDDDDEFSDEIGFLRLYKAIQAYVWPNLNYKEKHSKITSTATSSDASKTIRQNDRPMNQNEPSEKDVEKFENMLSNFSQMKEKASRMNDEDRKRYAEQMAIAVWNSISDDANETNLSSDEDDPNHFYV